MHLSYLYHLNKPTLKKAISAFSLPRAFTVAKKAYPQYIHLFFQYQIFKIHLIDFFSSKEILYVISHADAFLEQELPVIILIIFSPIFFLFNV